MCNSLIGFYALQIQMPLSGLSRRWRRFSRKMRDKEAQGLQQVRLPMVPWRAVERQERPGLRGPQGQRQCEAERAGDPLYTLDLKPEMDTVYHLDQGERHMDEKPRSGARIDAYRITCGDTVSRIHQLYGDSASFDFSPYYNSCGLVFIDASHAYDYVLSDSRAALKMLKPGGAILWHDYGIWSGVTDALEHLAAGEMPGIQCIQGTSLAYWRKRKNA